MTARIARLRPADYRVMPWKNGLGETVEIARSPAASTGLVDFDWRMSVAPVVADGAFSTFPGIERTIMVIEGEGMDLTLAGGSPHRLLPGEPFTYDGGLAVDGRLLAGSVRDLNLMVRRAACTGTLLHSPGPLAVSGRAAGRTIVAYALAGEWSCRAGGTVSGFAARECLRLDATADVVFVPDSSTARLAVAILDRQP